ncbi:conserved hypothetical protein [Uncinocarpus reesii 1704]|uniref:Uncharacterized protein n=1 Tax=Uncinocarpus reesii (strain UAMH 1704) TaxID=336963 RepID=C4K003_UNCRE|nr:uncharacterized protein UREG_07754 [Uncinocarpus reesii 1704]EEP82889.1 conserved hypothetical protein [Uncinocarpus reesii 1704]
MLSARLNQTATASNPLFRASSHPYPSHFAARFRHPHSSSASYDPRSSMTSHSSPPHRLPDRQRPSSQSHYTQQDRQRHDIDRAAYERTGGLTQVSPSSPVLQPTYRSSRSLGGSEATSPSRIKVRDLNHIQSFASEEILSSRGSTSNGLFQDAGRQYEISSMPVTDIIEMVAGLLTKITTTNDLQHEHIHQHIPPPEGATNLSQQTTSVLAFHGRNIPSISILNYLTRIHRYCPTTYEVFLSLLVYFDRMTEMVDKEYIQNLRRRPDRHHCQESSSPSPPLTATPGRGVGGLPLVELNHLELQFLLLNDFRLAIPVEELEAYGTMLVEFYAREVLSQRAQSQARSEGQAAHPDIPPAETRTNTRAGDDVYTFYHTGEQKEWWF